MRAVLCRLGLHSRFVQHDRWGSARVCRYCLVAAAPVPQNTEEADRG